MKKTGSTITLSTTAGAAIPRPLGQALRIIYN